MNSMLYSRIAAYSTAVVVLAIAGGCFFVSPETLEPQDEQEVRRSAPLTERAPSTTDEEGALRNAQELRRKAHLTVIRLTIDLSQLPDIGILKKSSHSTISRYVNDKTVTGRYYVTKQGVLLCEEGPCVIDWMVKFHYTDEGGKIDAFLLQSRETVFAGMGPQGNERAQGGVVPEWGLQGTEGISVGRSEGRYGQGPIYPFIHQDLDHHPPF